MNCVPRLVIAAPRSGEGKTSVSAALMAAFGMQGVSVAPFKVGPDYIDPSFHRFITGVPSINLDSWLLSETTIRELFCRRVCPVCSASGMSGATLCAESTAAFQNGSASGQTPGLAVIEGVMGLFDGQGTGHAGSTAHIAELLAAPVVLVLDGRGMSRSAAALVAGYAAFHPGVRVAGVICNRVRSEKHYALLRDVLEHQAGVPCFGWLPPHPEFALQRRHLGLVPAQEVGDLRRRMDLLAAQASASFDLAGLMALAARGPVPVCPGNEPSGSCVGNERHPETSPLAGKAAGPSRAGRVVDVCTRADMRDRTLRSPSKTGAQGTARNAQVSWRSDGAADPCGGTSSLRLGIARDAAFSFYYQDVLDLFISLGAYPVFFSPLHDDALPSGLDGLYLGGGFPELFAAGLAANLSMRRSVLEALENGLPAWAECGGMMYLCRNLWDMEGVSHPMVGFLGRDVEMTSRLQQFGYVEATFLHDTVLAPAGTVLRGHEFHHSRFRPETSEPQWCLRLEKPGGGGWPGGLSEKNVFAAYTHFHLLGAPELAAYFLERCRARSHGRSTSLPEPGETPTGSAPNARAPR